MNSFHKTFLSRSTLFLTLGVSSIFLFSCGETNGPSLIGDTYGKADRSVANVSVQKDQTDLSNVAVGTTATFTLTLTNQGPLSATLGQLTNAGLNLTAPFAVGTGGTCTSGQTLAVGASCTLVLTYSPTSAAQVAGSVSIPVSDGVTNRTAAFSFSGSSQVYFFASGQAAGVVIGQTVFTTKTYSSTRTTLDGPWGNPSIYQGSLYLTDYSNSRIMGYNTIPTSNGAPADFVIGQTNFTNSNSGTTSTTFNYPWTSAAYNNVLAVADSSNNRVLLFSPVPTSTNPTATTVLGQISFSVAATACNASSLNHPSSVIMGGGKLVVADYSNNRVLIWNSVPNATTNPDLVIGQPDMNTCTVNTGTIGAASLKYPGDVWTNGSLLIVADSGNHRMLIWKTFPTVNHQPADVVLGQQGFSGGLANQGGVISGAGFDSSTSDWSNVTSNGAQIFYSDYNNNRILIWNSIPSTNGLTADVVIGQTSFTANAAPNPPTASSLSGVGGITFYGNQFFVTDYGNSRVLIYNGHQ